MKKLYFFLLFHLSILTILYGQTTQTEQKTRQLIEERNIYLNGGARSQFGGKSRTYIQINLPENTLKWYYSFSTSPGESGTKSLSLLTQLTTLAIGPTGLASVLTDVEVPSGSQSIDVYLLDKTNVDRFIKKEDLNGGTFYYYLQGSVENTKHGIIEINEITRGTCFLGLKNPSSLNGVNILIEVVAVIEEKSEKQTKAELYGGMGWKQFEKDNYEKCIEYSNKALEHYELGWVYANKGLAELVLGRESDAIDSYIQAITLIKKTECTCICFKRNDQRPEKSIKCLSGIIGT